MNQRTNSFNDWELHIGQVDRDESQPTARLQMIDSLNYLKVGHGAIWRNSQQ